MTSPYQRNDKNHTLNTNKTIDYDLEALSKLRRDCPSNPMIGYLNIYSIRNKIVQLTDICKTPSGEIFCIDETKLGSTFANAQVHLPDCQITPLRRGQNS